MKVRNFERFYLKTKAESVLLVSAVQGFCCFPYTFCYVFVNACAFSDHRACAKARPNNSAEGLKFSAFSWPCKYTGTLCPTLSLGVELTGLEGTDCATAMAGWIGLGAALVPNPRESLSAHVPAGGRRGSFCAHTSWGVCYMHAPHAPVTRFM